MRRWDTVGVHILLGGSDDVDAVCFLELLSADRLTHVRHWPKVVSQLVDG